MGGQDIRDGGVSAYGLDIEQAKTQVDGGRVVSGSISYGHRQKYIDGAIHTMKEFESTLFLQIEKLQ